MTRLPFQPFVLVASLLIGCGLGPRSRFFSAMEENTTLERRLAAYEVFVQSDSHDLALLAFVAEDALLRAAQSRDPEVSGAAWVQLRLAGLAANRVVEELTHSDVPLVRARALATFAWRGDERSRHLLLPLLDARDADVVSEAILALDGAEDEARLVSLANHGNEKIRYAAIMQLGGAVHSERVFALLASIARTENSVNVRRGAVHALAKFGEPSLPVLEERLMDENDGIRRAATIALVRASGFSEELIRRLLAGPVASAPLEVARQLLSAPSTSPELRRMTATYLLQALNDAHPEIRSQAAVALSSLEPREGVLLERLRSQLQAETVPAIRLELAIALTNADDPLGEVAIGELVNQQGMTGVMASLFSCEQGQDAECERLVGDLHDEARPGIERRTIARGLATTGQRPFEVRHALLDADPLVAIYAAGGILSASNALRAGNL